LGGIQQEEGWSLKKGGVEKRKESVFLAPKKGVQGKNPRGDKLGGNKETDPQREVGRP